jgi:hypothetical protein
MWVEQFPGGPTPAVDHRLFHGSPGLLALRLAVTSLKLWPDSLKNFKSASAIARGIVPR